jgi:hypothetical protein
MKRKPDQDIDSTRNQKSMLIAGLFKLMSDEKTRVICNTIFLAGGSSSETLRAELKLTKKQYYSRITRLVKAGLVKRQKGKYYVSAFGKVIFDSHSLLGTAIKNYWKLKAIDSLGVANDIKMPKEQREKIIEGLIDNPQLKDISLSTNF